MRMLIFCLSITATFVVKAQTYREICQKYSPLQIISLSYKNIIDINNSVSSQKLTKQVSELAASISENPTKMASSIYELKTFIKTTGYSLAYLNIYLKDTTVLYKTAIDDNYAPIKAPIHKNDVYYWVLYIDKRLLTIHTMSLRTSNIKMPHVGNSAGNSGHIVERSLNELKDFEGDPFITDSDLLEYESTLSRFIEKYPESLNEISPDSYKQATEIQNKYKSLHQESNLENRLQLKPEDIERLKRNDNRLPENLRPEDISHPQNPTLDNRFKDINLNIPPNELPKNESIQRLQKNNFPQSKP